MATTLTTGQATYEPGHIVELETGAAVPPTLVTTLTDEWCVVPNAHAICCSASVAPCHAHATCGNCIGLDAYATHLLR
jgi:hypothetical protein